MTLADRPVRRRSALCATVAGSLLLLTAGGVAARGAGTPEWAVFNTSNSGLPNDQVSGIAMDRSGALWIATGQHGLLEPEPWTGGGVARFDGRDWTVYNTANSGLLADAVWDVAMAPDDTPWFATADGLAHFNGKTWTSYTPANTPFGLKYTTCLSFDRAAALWVGIWYTGVYRLAGGEWTEWTERSGLPDPPTAWVDVVEGRDGVMWIPTQNGLGWIDQEGAHRYTSLNSPLPNNEVGGLVVDSTGTVWMGTYKGLVTYDGQNWFTYNRGNSGLPTDALGRLALDQDGTLWIGTWGHGLIRYDGVTWTTFSTGNSELPDDRIYRLYVDPRGNLWIGTYGGGLAGYRADGLLLGTSTAVTEDQTATRPQSLRLGQNYPNPFNAATVIPFDLPQAAAVELTVCDLAGQRVRTLAGRDLPAGQQTAVWRGDDDTGQPVASGTYLCHLRIDGGRAMARKVVLVR